MTLLCVLRLMLYLVSKAMRFSTGWVVYSTQLFTEMPVLRHRMVKTTTRNLVISSLSWKEQEMFLTPSEKVLVFP
jgi:hypothetical protein